MLVVVVGCWLALYTTEPVKGSSAGGGQLVAAPPLSLSLARLDDC